MKRIKIFSLTIFLLVFIALLAVNGIFGAFTILEFALGVLACLIASVILDVANHVREIIRDSYLKSLGKY